MLRTTISKIKKVCTVAFVPRLLRGDQRCTPGRFEILSYAVVKKAQKSTKSADDDEFEHKKEKPKDGYECMFGPKEATLPQDKTDGEKNASEKMYNESITPLVAARVLPKESHSEKCQRLIDNAFGKGNMEPIMGEQYYSHSAVEINETRKEIKKAEILKCADESKIDKPVTDDRIQFGVFKTRDLTTKDPPETSVEPDDLIVNESILKATSKKDNKSFKTAKPLENLTLIPPTLNMHMSHRRDISTDENGLTQHVPQVEPTEELINTSIDKDSDENENVFASTATTDCKPNFVQREAPNFILQDTTNNYNQNVDKTAEFNQSVSSYINKQDTLESCYNWNAQHFRDTKTVHATTTEEPEEQLAQKLEHIDETPLVEAPKPDLEGFNVNPRVLGDMAPAFNCLCNKGVDIPTTGATPKVDIPASFDEVAKRCLDSPTSQIDEILLKEMEKLGIPITSNRDSNSRSPVIEDDLVQMDVLKKRPRRPTTDKKELDLESHEYERGAVDLYETTEELYPTHYVSNEVILPEVNPESVELHYERVLNREKVAYEDILETVESTLQKPQTTDLLDKTILPEALRLTIHPNQVIIDPYDKKTIAYDTGEFDPDAEYDPSNKFSYFYIPLKEQKIENEMEVTSPIEEDIYYDTRDTLLDDTAPKEDSATSYIKSKVNKPNTSICDNKQQSPDKHAQAYYTNKTATTNMLEKAKSGGSDATLNNAQLYCTSEAKARQIDPKGNETTPLNQAHLCIAQLNPKQETEMQQSCSKNIDATYSCNQKDTGTEDNTEQFDLDPTTIHRSYHKAYIQPIERAPFKPAEAEAFKTYATASEVPSSYISTETKKPKKGIPDYLWSELETDPEQKSTAEKVVASSFEKSRNVTPADIWEGEQLDPQHVLTCNETCPISPRPQHVNASESFRLEGTESIFENDPNVSESKNFTRSEPLYEHESYNKPKENEDSSSNKINRVSNFMQADSVSFAPLIKEQNTDENITNTAADDNMTVAIPADSPLPKLNEDVSLSELLRRVRERSRILECKSELKSLGVEVEPAEGKCRTRAPRCPPAAPRSPPNNPIPPPTFGLPPLKRRPPACKPRRKPSQTKFSSCDLDVSPSVQLGPTINSQMPPNFTEIACEMNNSGTELGVIRSRSKIDLTDEVIDRLETLGKKLVGHLRQGKAEVLEASVLLKSRRSKILLARNYEPWAPIPSWPSPKKEVPRKPRCNPGCSDPGCKLFPPPRVCHDPPCNQKPCICFPRKHFSLLDCFAVSLGDHKVYELGEF